MKNKIRPNEIFIYWCYFVERWRDQNAPEYSVKCYGTPMQLTTVHLPSILENSEKKHTVHIKTDRAGIKFIILMG